MVENHRIKISVPVSTTNSTYFAVAPEFWVHMHQFSSSELSNVIFLAFGASAAISLKWAPYSLDSCIKTGNKITKLVQPVQSSRYHYPWLIEVGMRYHHQPQTLMWTYLSTHAKKKKVEEDYRKTNLFLHMGSKFQQCRWYNLPSFFENIYQLSSKSLP